MKTIVQELFGTPTDETKLNKFARGFLVRYLRDGLGVMTKRETETLVMHELEKAGCFHQNQDANHDLSLVLRIPESRVVALRYEANLRYPPEDPDEYALSKLLSVLWLSELQADGRSIRLVIEDRYVRQYLTALAKRQHSIVDTSFNREILEIDHKKLETVIRAAFGKAIGDRFEKEFKRTLDGQHKITFAEVKKEFFKGLASGMGSAVPKAIKLAAMALVGSP